MIFPLLINLNNKPLVKLEILKAQLRSVQEEKESAVSADSIEDYQKAADLKTKECTLLERMEKIEKELDIQIYHGQEVYFTENILEDLKGDIQVRSAICCGAHDGLCSMCAGVRESGKV